DLIASETGPVTEILAARAAIFTDAAGPAEPRHADPIAEVETVDRFSLLDDDADDLVPGNERQFRIGKLAVDDMQTGPADGAGADRDQQLLRAGMRRRQFRRGQRAPDGGQHLCAHEPLRY